MLVVTDLGEGYGAQKKQHAWRMEQWMGRGFVCFCTLPIGALWGIHGAREAISVPAGSFLYGYIFIGDLMVETRVDTTRFPLKPHRELPVTQYAQLARQICAEGSGKTCSPPSHIYGRRKGFDRAAFSLRPGR